jgi:hypothetical protein
MKALDSIETKMIKVLKTIGVELIFNVLKAIGMELSSYHGGSLNDKDIKKVMNNSTYVFDQHALIFKEGKRPDYLLLNDDIADLYLHFREVFVLLDGAFSLARTNNPDIADISTYQDVHNSSSARTYRPENAPSLSKCI